VKLGDPQGGFFALFQRERARKGFALAAEFVHERQKVSDLKIAFRRSLRTDQDAAGRRRPLPDLLQQERGRLRQPRAGKKERVRARPR
jgi:hypothetical protein